MTLHFAYGSNMDRAMMRRRCPGAQEAGRAVLDGFRTIVNDDGLITVVRAPGVCVHGVLWRIGVRDRAALNAYEGLDVGLYRAVTLPVRFRGGRSGAPGGARVRALLYLARSSRRGRPKPGYLPLVLDAARAASLPDGYVAALARLGPAGFFGTRARDIGEFSGEVSGGLS